MILWNQPAHLPASLGTYVGTQVPDIQSVSEALLRDHSHGSRDGHSRPIKRPITGSVPVERVSDKPQDQPIPFIDMLGRRVTPQPHLAAERRSQAASRVRWRVPGSKDATPDTGGAGVVSPCS